MPRRPPEGITVRHTRSCPSGDGRPCRCSPTYQAQAWSSRDRKRLTRTFPTLAAARSWRHDAQAALGRGTLRAGGKLTIRQSAEQWLEAAKAGLILNRSGDSYKPSSLRGYEQGLRDRIIPELGSKKLPDVRRSDVQRLINRMVGEGHDPSTIRNALMPLRAIYRQALALDEVAVNPTSGVQLPAVRGKRDRVASPSEAVALLAALPDDHRAFWATALYAGLRFGELIALRWPDVDLEAGVLHVSRSYDTQAAQFIEPKSRAGHRTVPIGSALRGFLLEHQMRSGRRSGLVFGQDGQLPVPHATVWNRARTAWKRAGLRSIGLHECRHTYASLMIAAGVNPKALASFMGHASVTITLDRYGHLFPGSEDEAAGLLDAYLARATGGQTS